MNRATQIEWWVEQVEATRRNVGGGQDERRRSPRSNPLDEEPRARAGRVAPLPNPQAAHIVLRGATITGERDEERTRPLFSISGGGGGAASAVPKNGSATSADGLAGGAVGLGTAASGRAQQLAAGYQPAVVKVLSYAYGSARATATAQYVQREDVPIETHDGRMLADHEVVAAEIKDWSKDFEKRKPSDDVAAIRLQLHGVSDTPQGREIYEKAITAGFEGHRRAGRIDGLPSGQIEARLVIAMAGGPRERFRVRDERIGTKEDGFDQKRLDPMSEALVKARIHAATGYPLNALSLEPGAPRHGRDGVSWQLTRLFEKGGALMDDRGRAIASVADARNAAKEWGRSLRSQSPRDTMHLMLSAKAGSDVAALKNAARAFLQDRFGDHKFVFGVHTDKEAQGHIHIHAVITVKNESGQKIHPGRDDFKIWREAYAQHAQEQGLRIVATSAMERASSQSYGARDKAIVEIADRPRPAREARDRSYASDPTNQRLIDNARQRIETARKNLIRLPSSEPERRAVSDSVIAWNAVAREDPQNSFAKDMLERLAMAQVVGGMLHAMEKRVHHLSKAEDSGMAITSQQMAKDLRAMNDAVSRTGDLLDGATKQEFHERSARYLETLANRTDLQRAQEHGTQELSRTEVGSIVGNNADSLIERARTMRGKDEREAESAQRLADQAIETERRQEGLGGIDPQSQRDLIAGRAIVAGSQQSAAREAREAAAAADVARALAVNPAVPLPQTLIQSDALAKLRAEQEKLVGDIEAERIQTQSTKGERIT